MPRGPKEAAQPKAGKRGYKKIQTETLSGADSPVPRGALAVRVVVG